MDQKSIVKVFVGTIYTSFQPLNRVECLIQQGGIIIYLGDLKEAETVLSSDNLLGQNFKIEQLLELRSENTNKTHLNDIEIEFLQNDQMLMHGFIDSHVHPQAGGIQLQKFQIRKYCGWLEAKEHIKEYIKSIQCQEGQWIFIYGYAQGWFKDYPQSIQELDELSPNNPLLVMRDDLHSYWGNSLVMKISGITLETQGCIVKLNGELNGVVSENEMNLIRYHIPKVSLEEQKKSLMMGINSLVQNGVVGYCDAAVKENLFEAYMHLYNEDRILPWCSISLCWNRLFLEQTQNEDCFLRLELLDDLLKKFRSQERKNLYCHCVKIFIDGVVESKTALVNTHYCGCNHGGQLMIQDLATILLALNQRSLQAHMHSIGDAATDAIIQALEGIENNPDVINFVAHLQFVKPDAIKAFKKYRLGCNFSPLWFYEDPNISMLNDLLPKDYQNKMYPIKELQDQIIGFGSDWPVSSNNPLFGIEVAVTRQPLGHSQGPVPIADLTQRITLEQALHYYTEGSAQLCQKPGQGILKVGQSADLIIISDLFKLKLYQIHEAKVLATYIRGNEVYLNPEYYK